jgi:adenosine deaminase
VRAAPPTAELHVHLEGTLEPELIYSLAERSGTELPYRDIDELRSRYQFDDLQSFLNLYYANMQVLHSEQDFADMTAAYLERASAAGVRHAELFFDPQAHLTRGVPLGTMVQGIGSVLSQSIDRFGVSTSLIACFLRDRDPQEALTVLHDLLEMHAPIIGVGLDSAEQGYPPRPFQEVFDVAARHGLRRVAHAGEEGPPEYIWESLNVLGVERVDHGVRSLEDPALVRHLVDQQVPLTVCPLSNVRLKGVPTLGEHSLPRLMEEGLLVSINSDDPAYFGGYVDDNYRAISHEFGLVAEDLARLAKNSIASSFITEQRRSELDAEVDAWLASD